MIGHLEDSDLARIISGSSTSMEAGEAVLHVAVCAHCHRRLLSRYPRKGRLFLESWLEEFASEKGVDVRELAVRLPQSFGALREEEIRAVRRAPALMRRLRGLSEAHQRLHIGNSSRFHSLAFLEHTLAEARLHWHSSPGEAVQWASLAVDVAHQAEIVITRSHGRPVWANVLARAWAYLANGHRIAGDFHTADGALAKSWLVLGEGTGSLEVRAELLSLEGSLRRDQRNFSEALVAASEAEKAYETLGRPEAAALAALVGSSALAEAGDLDGAIKKLRRALTGLSEATVSERTHFYLLQNLAWRLVEADKPKEASRVVPKVKELANHLSEPLIDLRVEWLEARILSQFRRTHAAEAMFRRVREAFLSAGSPYDVALVSLDLAVLLIEDGRRKEAADLARELVPIFRSRGIHREATAAGILLARSLSEEKATADFVHEVAKYLRLARHDPSYRFST